jgi:lipoprotein-anchoring transpeptidase ErfK/SrfK
MRRICVSALLVSALSVSAWADPLQITPGAYGAGDGQNPPERSAAPAAGSPPVYAAVAQPNLGGGFIQFLFGGAAPDGSYPHAYQPAPAAAQPALQPQPAALTSEPDPSDAAPGTGEDHPAVDPKFDRQLVAYSGTEQPGTIIIDTPNKFLYLVADGGKAMRYGIGVGRPGFTWAGVKAITAKREWPDWRPPDDMLARQPQLPRFMAGGPENPLGARAMYLGSSLYRIHGSNEPWTIGHNVSSGCIRLRNADIIDLYNRVKVGTKVLVM